MLDTFYSFRYKFKSFYSGFKYFFINIWRFRKQLSEFRAFDYQYNLNIYIRSLEITRDFMNSEKALSSSAKEVAQEIDYTLQLFDDYKNHIEIAEKELGYTFGDDFLVDQSEEEQQKTKALLNKIEEIEEDSWNEAFDNMKKNMRKWWD